MKWTEEAEQMMGKAPGFVRKMIRKKAEAEAKAQKINTIDAAFLNALHEKGMGKGHAARGFPIPKETNDPLHEAFDKKFGIHAGMFDGEDLPGDPADHFFHSMRSERGFCISKSSEQRERQPLEEGKLTTEYAENTEGFQGLENPLSGGVPEGRGGSPKPAMAYIHIPFCCTRCLFCGFYSEATEPEAILSYTDALAQEIRQTAESVRATGRKLHAVYFGGGTPTDLTADELSLLVKTVGEELPLSDDCEITIEGRLYDFDDAKVEAVLAAGVNRFSFGVQSFDTKIRQKMGRKLSHEEVIARLNRIAELAEPYRAAVVIDLIYGLPGQTETEWIADIDCAVNETHIHGLDLYQINLIPSTPLFQQKDNLPPMADLREQGTLFSKGRKRMVEHGFDRLSIAHWGRDERERNRYNLWNKRGIDCLPLGAGAGGRWGNVRLFQQSDVKLYKQIVSKGRKPIASATEVPSFGKITAKVIGQLEQQQLDVQGLETSEKFRPMLEQWEKAGLIEMGEPCRLTEAGEFWVVNLQQLISDKIKKVTKSCEK